MDLFNYKLACGVISALSALGVTGLGTTVGMQQSSLNARDEELVRKNDEIQIKDGKIQEKDRELDEIKKRADSLTDEQIDGMSDDQLKSELRNAKQRLQSLDETVKNLAEKNAKLEIEKSQFLAAISAYKAKVEEQDAVLLTYGKKSISKENLYNIFEKTLRSPFFKERRNFPLGYFNQNEFGSYYYKGCLVGGKYEIKDWKNGCTALTVKDTANYFSIDLDEIDEQ